MSCDSSELHIMVCLEAVCTVACNINRERTCNVLLILVFYIIIPQIKKVLQHIFITYISVINVAFF